MIDFAPVEMASPTVRVPPLMPQNTVDFHGAADIEEWSYEIVEWLGLVGLGSARVQANDNVDPVLCRWDFPAGTPKQATSLRILQWQGMVDAGWIIRLLIRCM